MMRIKNIILAVMIAGVATAAEPSVMITPPLVIDRDAETVASVANGNMRLRYVRCGEGKQALGCTMEAKVNGQWLPFGSAMEDNKVFVITGPAKNKRPSYKSFYPAWTSGDSLSTNPWLAGSVCEAVPVAVRNLDRNTIEVDYVTAGNHAVRGTWTLAPEAMSATLRLDFTPAVKGTYSLGVMGAHAPLPSAVSNVLLPPMYQYRRLPEQPQMMLSAMMPTPVAMVEINNAGQLMTAFVSADSTLAPLDWGGVDHSPMGFGLKNAAGPVEPVAFSPVLGMADCVMPAGSTVSRTFEVGLSAAPWNETLERVVSGVYGVKDYRKQTDVSLTDAMFNIIDLMGNDEFGGWDKSMRGFYDIEGKPTKAPTVVHSAPLAVIAAAINGADERLYIERALPTIEYTLSRKGYRWSTRTTDEGYNKDPETLRLSPFGSQFTTSYYDGLNRLLGGLNPWLVDIAMLDGEPRAPKGYSTPVLSWVQALAAYRLTGDRKWLRRARSVATRDAQKHIYTNSTKPMRYQAFYNSTIYAPWWDFLDLYETTGDKQFLDAARAGAAHTLAGMRTWPAVKDSVQTIHPGNVYNGNATMWWKGSEQFRLGFPRREGDAPEHQVEQWRVSPVGLGFEQPSTYFLRTRKKLVRPVFMSSWAPALLRLGQMSGAGVFETAARNAVIGRFTNYPGYYATGYTDLTMGERFPYEGPDVSSIYYHHIPPHLAFTADYLVSEAETRSGGKVKFPYGRQEGFVWFSNRVYGGAPGRVYDDADARLWLRKGLLTVSDPQVNYLTAVSERRFWILLCNESAEPLTVSVEPGGDVAPLLDFGAMKKGVDLSAVKLQPKGFTAIAVPLKDGAVEQSPELQALFASARMPRLDKGHIVTDSGSAAGRIHTFRIRSPFGWDSVYGYCETPPADGIRVEVKCNGQTVDIDQYPYEWSFMKFAPDAKAEITVTVTGADGKSQTNLIKI